MAAISTWSKTAGSNNSAPPDGAPEGWKPSEVNAWAREIMAQVRTWYEDAEWLDFGHTLTYISGTQFSTAAGDGDTTGIYQVGRRIKTTVTLGTYYGRITGSSHSTVTTVTILFDSGSMDAGLSLAAVGAASVTNKSIPDVLSIENNTRMLFQQSIAPTGWTKESVHDDIALRLTTGSVGSGGATAFNTAFGSGKTTGSHTLITSEMPSHAHWDTTQSINVQSGAGASVADNAFTSLGGGSGHTHTLSLDLKYLDCIIAVKDAT